MKTDSREQIMKEGDPEFCAENDSIVTPEIAEKKAQEKGIVTFFECSVLERKGVKKVW